MRSVPPGGRRPSSRGEPRFERIEGGAVLVQRRPWRLPALVAVPLVLVGLVLAGTALGVTAALVGSPLLVVALSLGALHRRTVLVKVQGDLLSWGASGSLRLADVLEHEQHHDHVQFKLRDGGVARVPIGGPGIATSSFLAVVRGARR